MRGGLEGTSEGILEGRSFHTRALEGRALEGVFNSRLALQGSIS